MGVPGADVVERAGLKAWPGIDVAYDGQWVLRAAQGYTKRANSVQSLDVTDEANAPQRVAASRAWFEVRGLQPVFRVTPLAGPAIVTALDEAGWKTIDASHLFAMELGSVLPDPRAEIYPLLDKTFLSIAQRLQGYTDERLASMRALLAMIEVPAVGVVLYSETGAPVASALFDIADGIVITGNVVTDVAQRRKGYGAAMMRTGLSWAHENGATVAALNVAADNPGGQALYRSLGYQRQYDYAYRVPADA